jgi:hypothetical protein
VEHAELDLARAGARLPIPPGAVVTAAALLDVVSEPWLGALAERCRAAGAPALFALTYDGRMSCLPAEPDDALVARAFNAHQLRDKGFGPALGPGAPSAAIRLFTALGYEARSAPSDWRLDAAHAALQAALIEGWCAAAREQTPSRTRALEAWRERRLAQSAAGALRLTVGHVDVALLPRCQ